MPPLPAFLLPALALSLATSLPLAWKWNLGVARTAVVVMALSLATGGLTEVVFVTIHVEAGAVPLKIAVNWLLTLGISSALLMYRFFRDPEREVPTAPGVVVSPADGEVLYVRESRNGALPVSTKVGRSYTLEELAKTPLQMSEASVIGIGMNFLDNHVNRAPIEGRIAMMRRFPGPFGSLRRPEMVFANERMTTLIKRGDLQVAVIQIASRLVRRIVPFVDESQEVERGQRIGMIRFGSQVDLVLPRRAELEVTVRPGDRVTAGVSIVAVLRAQAGPLRVDDPGPGGKRSKRA
jgi:phosphatidylserine decarboxylase